MKIADSAIQLYSNHLSVEQHQKRESLTVWDQGQERKTTTDNEGRGREMRLHHHSSSLQATNVSISAEAMKAQPVKAVADPVSEEDEVMTDLNMRILKAMFVRITGKEIRINTAENAALPVTATAAPSARPPRRKQRPLPILPFRDPASSTTITSPIRNMRPQILGPRGRL